MDKNSSFVFLYYCVLKPVWQSAGGCLLSSHIWAKIFLQYSSNASLICSRLCWYEVDSSKKAKPFWANGNLFFLNTAKLSGFLELSS